MARFTVKKGDSPFSVAKEFGISTSALLNANPGIRSFKAGMVLTVPTARPDVPSPAGIKEFGRPFAPPPPGADVPSPIGRRTFGSPPAPQPPPTFFAPTMPVTPPRAGTSSQFLQNIYGRTPSPAEDLAEQARQQSLRPEWYKRYLGGVGEYDFSQPVAGLPIQRQSARPFGQNIIDEQVGRARRAGYLEGFDEFAQQTPYETVARALGYTPVGEYPPGYGGYGPEAALSPEQQARIEALQAQTQLSESEQAAVRQAELYKQQYGIKIAEGTFSDLSFQYDTSDFARDEEGNIIWDDEATMESISHQKARNIARAIYTDQWPRFISEESRARLNSMYEGNWSEEQMELMGYWYDKDNKQWIYGDPITDPQIAGAALPSYGYSYNYPPGYSYGGRGYQSYDYPSYTYPQSFVQREQKGQVPRQIQHRPGRFGLVSWRI